VIGLAFLGCGRVTRAHAKRLHRHAKDLMFGFASRDRARAEQYSRDLGGPAFGTYQEAIESPDVDVVVVATPPASHLDLARRALAAGKHVVLEKPPLPQASDFDAIEEAARAAGKRVFVAENYFYKPAVRRLQRLLAARVVGDVLFVHVNAIKRQKVAAGDWRDDPDQALGGALYEGGIHWVDLMANLGMGVKAVRGFAPRLAPGARAERSMMVSFEYDAGAVGMLSYSWEVPSTARGLRLSKIYGRSGSITFESNGLWVLCHGKKTRFYLSGWRDLAGYHAMWDDFVSAWKERRDAKMTVARARRDLALVEQAYDTASLPPPSVPLPGSAADAAARAKAHDPDQAAPAADHDKETA
jgi:predicted dehydrogenase